MSIRFIRSFRSWIAKKLFPFATHHTVPLAFFLVWSHAIPTAHRVISLSLSKIVHGEKWFFLAIYFSSWNFLSSVFCPVSCTEPRSLCYSSLNIYRVEWSSPDAHVKRHNKNETRKVLIFFFVTPFCEKRQQRIPRDMSNMSIEWCLNCPQYTYQTHSAHQILPRETERGRPKFEIMYSISEDSKLFADDD